MENLNMGDLDVFKDALSGMPVLPPKTTIAFRCRDCDCVWTFGIETPISFEKFYQKNKECPNCDKANIEINIIALSSSPID
jgi:hypothetical protein